MSRLSSPIYGKIFLNNSFAECRLSLVEVWNSPIGFWILKVVNQEGEGQHGCQLPEGFYVLSVHSVLQLSSLMTTGFINSIGMFQTYYQQVLLKTHDPFRIGWISPFLICTVNIVMERTIIALIVVGNGNGTALRQLWTSVATAAVSSNCYRKT